MLPTATSTAFPTPPFGFAGTIITYTYDPLNRLTAADYSTGDHYHYTYDAVGNRLSQMSSVSGLLSTVGYTYDDANRLITVGGITYTWDDNGNLLSDGVNTYHYDSANRLDSLTHGTNVTSYAYNGLGDRLKETTNGVTTTFVMDLNMGLTQTLSDGTNIYLYGAGRIAQQHGSTTEYFLGDALGSVRQLTDQTGVISYARAYDPYGVVAQTSGASQSAYGFTGEYQQGYTDLVYLRARHYSTTTGHFLTRDTWSGDANRPLSFNRWGYTEGNPINRIDPTGHSTNFPFPVCFGLNCGWDNNGTGNILGILNSIHLMLVNCGASEGSNIENDSAATPTLTGGAAMQQLFHDLQSDHSWWWWQTHDSFNVPDFITVAVYYEMAGWIHDNAVAALWTEAFVRRFYDRYQTLSDANIFEFLGQGYQSIRDRYINRKFNPRVYNNGTMIPLGNAENTSKLLYSPPGSWLFTGNYDPYPYSVGFYGNGYTTLADDVNPDDFLSAPQGTGPKEIYYRTNNSNGTVSFILTKCQESTWEDNNHHILGCP